MKIILLSVLMYVGAYSSPNDTLFFINDPDNILSDSKKTILSIPINKINEEFYSNAKRQPGVNSPDSFFIESAHGLINYECSKYFSLCSYSEGLKEINDSIHLFYSRRYSKVSSDTMNFSSASEIMKTTAEKFRTDLILLSYSCDISHITFQQKAWSDAPEYQKPIKYFSKVRIHLQIWDKNGKLLYEGVGKDKTKRPVFYSLFQKENPKKGEKIDSFAKRFYAPPAIRSLSAAIADAFKFSDNDR